MIRRKTLTNTLPASPRGSCVRSVLNRHCGTVLYLLMSMDARCLCGWMPQYPPGVLKIAHNARCYCQRQNIVARKDQCQSH